MPDPNRPEEPPRYTRHRARPGFLARLGGREDGDLAALKALRAREQELDAGHGHGPGPAPATRDGGPVRDEQGRALY
ncbi:MAG: hypothetical protein JWN65_485, partial [Solirubrobacterales bacterium]|nr:hypothetical protein [Solirubrobacterales bacterium]